MLDMFPTPRYFAISINLSLLFWDDSLFSPFFFASPVFLPFFQQESLCGSLFGLPVWTHQNPRGSSWVAPPFHVLAPRGPPPAPISVVRNYVPRSSFSIPFRSFHVSGLPLPVSSFLFRFDSRFVACLSPSLLALVL